ncbi:MAG: transcriptional repressor LexA [Anaerolineales bacterium]|nr:transcriptional repressor LexA [Anaerolineales bacterium]
MSNKKQLTKRQSGMLKYILERIQDDNRPPTIREIGGALNISSTSVVNYNLSRLEERGLVERERTVSRGLRLTDSAYNMLGLVSNTVQGLVSLPIIGTIVASEPVEVGNDGFDSHDENDTIEISNSMLPRNKEGLFALRVNGNSMVDDMINDGDIVVIKQQEIANDGDMVAAWVTGEGNTLKRIYRENGRIRLQPSNPTMEPIYADPDDVQVQGKVMLVMRNTA